MTRTAQRLFLGGAVVAVLVAVVGAASLLRSPAEERARRVDNRRVADLRALAEAIDAYCAEHDRPPSSLDEMAGQANLTQSLVDPETREPYAYRVLEGKRYELCATFATELPAREAPLGFWGHGTGQRCFQLRARDVPR